MSEQRDLSADVTTGREKGSRLRRIGIYAAMLLVAFLLGLIPMWLKARESAGELERARRDLHIVRMQSALASAAIDTRRGEYEPARQSASDFFTTLSAEIDRGAQSVLTEQQRTALNPLLRQRDEVITLLARNDPASSDRLTDLYSAYRKTMGTPPAAGSR